MISPGSRSTPLTLCFDAQPVIRTWIQLDERSAGFFALGMGRASGRPAVLVCTSGTAAANYLPAVVEASHAGIPMIVCTADRPPELRGRGWGSPQTIDQVGLYGTAVRWSIDLPVPDEAGPGAATGWAETAVASASGRDPGPVHLNWPLREPLEPVSTVPVQGESPAEVDAGRTAGDEDLDPAKELSDLAGIAAECERGVVVVGPWPGGGLDREPEWAAQAGRFASWAGWPLIGEPISHIRCGSGTAGSAGGPGYVVATADHLLADEALAEALRPDVAVLVGRTVTTKPVRLWLERARPRHVVLIDPEDRWEQAVFRLTGHVPAAAEALSSITAGAAPPGRDAPGEWARHLVETRRSPPVKRSEPPSTTVRCCRPAPLGSLPAGCPTAPCWLRPTRCRSGISTPSCSTPDRSSARPTGARPASTAAPPPPWASRRPTRPGPSLYTPGIWRCSTT